MNLLLSVLLLLCLIVATTPIPRHDHVIRPHQHHHERRQLVSPLHPKDIILLYQFEQFVHDILNEFSESIVNKLMTSVTKVMKSDEDCIVDLSIQLSAKTIEKIEAMCEIKIEKTSQIHAYRIWSKAPNLHRAFLFEEYLNKRVAETLTNKRRLALDSKSWKKQDERSLIIDAALATRKKDNRIKPRIQVLVNHWFEKYRPYKVWKIIVNDIHTRKKLLELSTDILTSCDELHQELKSRLASSDTCIQLLYQKGVNLVPLLGCEQATLKDYGLCPPNVRLYVKTTDRF